jgi:hypothetical protein
MLYVLYTPARARLPKHAHDIYFAFYAVKVRPRSTKVWKPFLGGGGVKVSPMTALLLSKIITYQLQEWVPPEWCQNTRRKSVFANSFRNDESRANRFQNLILEMKITMSQKSNTIKNILNHIVGKVIFLLNYNY